MESEGDFAKLVSVARTHSRSEVRVEAIEGLGGKENAESLATLKEIVDRDENVRVQREAVEALARIADGQSISILKGFATSHPKRDVRRERWSS
jgi:HEAT repeat protein